MNSVSIQELLIDFCELIGSHSGENLSVAVWSTMELYGLEGWVSYSLHYYYMLSLPYLILEVIAINCDNASNNNTMVEELEGISTLKSYDFDAN